MNKIISDSLIVLLVSLLLVTHGGCTEKQDSAPEEAGDEIQEGSAGEIDEEALAELQYEPIPGIPNSRYRGYAGGNIRYIKAPTEKELIGDYYSSK